MRNAHRVGGGDKFAAVPERDRRRHRFDIDAERQDEDREADPMVQPARVVNY